MKRTTIIAIIFIITLTLIVAIVLNSRHQKKNDDINDGQTESIENATEQTSNTDEEGYYWDNSQEVIEVIDVKESKKIPSESEVIHLLNERGFTDCIVTYPYDLNGDYYEDAEINEDSSEKRPMYLAYYLTDKGEVWNIHIINGEIFAYPVSYNLDSELNVEVIVSETEYITSYDCETNKFYVTVPKETVVRVIHVDRIDKKTLERLDFEEISDYEN